MGRPYYRFATMLWFGFIRKDEQIRAQVALSTKVYVRADFALLHKNYARF